MKCIVVGGGTFAVFCTFNRYADSSPTTNYNDVPLYFCGDAVKGPKIRKDLSFIRCDVFSKMHHVEDVAFRTNIV